MGVMKRNLFLALCLTAFMAVPAFAEMTVEESTDAEYLINSGYSQAVAEDIFIQKNRVSGKPIEPLYEKSQNKFVKLCRKVYAYIDPAQDEVDRLHHDIKLSPSFSDL